MRVGITFFLPSKPSSIWSCGATQACVFLARCLAAIPGVEVIPINGGDGKSAPPGLLLDGLGLRFERFDAVKDSIDVLIQAGAQIPRAYEQHVHASGGAVVAYKFGNEWVIQTEHVIHEKKATGIVNGSRFDAVWSLPHHVNTCGAFWETVYRAPVVPVPYVWDPTFVNAAIREFPDGQRWGYSPGRGRKRIAIYEPNINVVKTSIPALLVAEQAYRSRPASIDHVYVACSQKLRTHLYSRSLVGSLDMYRDKRVSFEGRRPLPGFQAKYADFVVAHQWECGLNNAYCEILSGHYPMVHNSPLLPDGVGYRYSGFDYHEGGATLASALEGHDDRIAEYNDAADRYVETLRPDLPRNVGAHASALQSVTERRAAA